MTMQEHSFTSKMPPPTIRIYTDFDGTMTQQDVGADLFRHFSGEEYFEEIRGRWKAGELEAPVAYQALCKRISSLTMQQLRQFLEPYEIDPAFPRFMRWCEENGYPLLVLSDGVDLYIDILMERAGMEFPYLSNTMRLTGGTPLMDFPYFDSRCPEVAHCKSNQVALRSQEDDIIVYIGDGTSDFEAAGYADMVLARGALERYCQEQNITFRRFYNFTTVREILSLMISQNTLRRKKRAQVRRRRLWSGG